MIEDQDLKAKLKTYNISNFEIYEPLNKTPIHLVSISHNDIIDDN